MSEPPSIEQVWSTAVDALVASGRITGSDFGFTALVSPRGFLGDTALLAVASPYTKDHLEVHLREPLTEALSAAAGRPVNFAVTIDEALEEPLPPATEPRPIPFQGSFGLEGAGDDTGEIEPIASPIAFRPPPPESRLQARYTFDTFVVGRSNRFAAAAAQAVAESPASTYNPLFIFGRSGLGKTHLLHAIGNYALALTTPNQPNMRVLYTTSEDFTNDFISHIAAKKMEEFKRFYRSHDILLIDDIQFLADKGATTEEFFHTFNSLYNSGSHIVITSDTPPKQLVGFEDRLRTRFEWGLLTDIVAPDLEMRIAILRLKATREGLDAPDDVQEYIASLISSNVRELEGALIRVTAFASLNRQPVTLALAEVVLRDLVTDSQSEITPALIIGQTAQYFSVTIEDICGPSRRPQFAYPRHVAMYLCRELTELSLPVIGREFGGRDHTTVINALKKIAKQLPQDPVVFNTVRELTHRIKQCAAEQ
ncbi:MAG: chromosomal replication initiator protein DnaA [Bifidobacteriaceae bacterium]|nr:chromosomal replication initiator protein DnaA [Bifidobacteriaceae bacterium]